MRDQNETDFISQLKSIPELDAEYAINALGGSVTLYETLLKKTLRLLPSNIDQMDHHIGEGGDISTFAVKAHGIKGSLNQIGCFALARLAESLEKAAKAEDVRYCAENYGSFRENLMSFYNLLSAAVTQAAEASAPAGAADKGELVKALLRAKEAAADFDAISASEILAPFADRHFGEDADALLAKVTESLDLFNNRQALTYINELLEKCESPTPSYEQEETL